MRPNLEALSRLVDRTVGLGEKQLLPSMHTYSIAPARLGVEPRPDKQADPLAYFRWKSEVRTKLHEHVRQGRF